MVAPAVLAAAAKAAKAAKTAQKAKQLLDGQRGKKGGKRPGRKTKVAAVGILLSGGACFVATIMVMNMVGGLGAGSSNASCTDYADNANAGNTGAAAATNPIMPAGKMYMPSEAARNEIPPKMILAAMRGAANYEGLDWTIIAGQMYQETKFGQDKSAAPGGKNSAGYMGILQFGNPAWQDYGDDGNGDGKEDLYNIDDASWAAANFLHAKKVESAPWQALLSYSGSNASNTIYPRVVLTQAARYRGELTGDKDLIKRWYAHLKETVEKNPDFPTLGQQSDIPEPVGNDAQVGKALSIAASAPRDWSTPPLNGTANVGSATAAGLTTALSPAGYTVADGDTDILAAPEPERRDGWQWPMKQGTYIAGTPYHKSGSMWSLGYHTGLDLVAPTGTPIYAPADGTVVSAGPGGSYGNMTTIEHKDGVITLYAHQVRIDVTRGQQVKRGDRIGLVGATGNVTGPHLHWEVRVPGVDNPFVGGHDAGPGMVDPEAWVEGRLSANPDYGTVPGSNEPAKDAQYADCAEENGSAAVAPDGAGATGVLPDSDDPVIRAVLGWAQRGLGTPYVYGAPRLQGENPKSFDCSSLTQWAYYMASGGKINIGSTTRDQQPYLRAHKVPLSEAQPGDVIFFRPNGDGTSGHVGLVWDPKGHQIIHAPRPGKTVSFSKWDYQDEITGVYRVPIPEGTNVVEGDGRREAA
ncbi:peptidoglycan DD-metalloendopeptidase family protein [Streptomyces stelliscabiei]|uniref:Murein DD-endopeptidase MepM/ murein hydrolase activator NlpD n=1 Tax=Streptomyces stelliscabiei TaxID=146820 RepID=A0A8I0PCC3_9ACTN|nr:peptidoglycan DD-metalloendopeptidase family protein [Streptomyces stelliscabiei]KND29054.1 peptidase [Streptomyces stelliscabiei]MBE1599088.1 murein DD-endopeptidase MepM/ murein hydrolase activator NlpD [Streptomyces stelliscabiei]MDX2520054.1 peptidoglycan DD-metalloendopeptidase family protein [Streptomyces stelliscabiei]